MSTVDGDNDNYQEEKINLKKRAIDVLPEAGGSVGGALVGLAVGGPAGAIAGATVAPAASALLHIVKDALQRRTERAENVLLRAAELSDGSVADLENRLTQSDDRLAFAVSVLTAAADTPLEEKITAFARLLAAGVQVDTNKLVDEYAMIAKALAAMDEPHIQLLAAISSSREDQDEPRSGLLPEDLARKFDTGPEFLRPYVRLLEFYGLITDVGFRTPETQGTVRWQITDLGMI